MQLKLHILERITKKKADVSRAGKFSAKLLGAFIEIKEIKAGTLFEFVKHAAFASSSLLKMKRIFLIRFTALIPEANTVRAFAFSHHPSLLGYKLQPHDDPSS